MSSVEEWGEDSSISSITFLDVRREQGSVHDKMKRIESFNGYVKKTNDFNQCVPFSTPDTPCRLPLP